VDLSILGFPGPYWPMTNHTRARRRSFSVPEHEILEILEGKRKERVLDKQRKEEIKIK